MRRAAAGRQRRNQRAASGGALIARLRAHAGAHARGREADDVVDHPLELEIGASGRPRHVRRLAHAHHVDQLRHQRLDAAPAGAPGHVDADRSDRFDEALAHRPHQLAAQRARRQVRI